MSNVAIALLLTASLAAPITACAQFAYASNEKDGTITVIDTRRDAVTGSIKVGKTPRGIGFVPDGSRAYVARELANTVFAIDVANRKVLASIPAGGRSNGIKGHLSGKEDCVSNGADGTVMVIDTATKQKLADIKVGDTPWGVFIPEGH